MRFNLDSVPAPVRHFIITFLGAALSVLVTAVVAHGGVVGLDWNPLIMSALGNGLVAALGAVGLLSSTPLTGQYGLFARKTDVSE